MHINTKHFSISTALDLRSCGMFFGCFPFEIDEADDDEASSFLLEVCDHLDI